MEKKSIAGQRSNNCRQPVAKKDRCALRKEDIARRSEQAVFAMGTRLQAMAKNQAQERRQEEQAKKNTGFPGSRQSSRNAVGIGWMAYLFFHIHALAARHANSAITTGTASTGASGTAFNTSNHDSRSVQSVESCAAAQAPGVNSTLLHWASLFATQLAQPLRAVDAALTYLTMPWSGVDSAPLQGRYQRHIFQAYSKKKKIPAISADVDALPYRHGMNVFTDELEDDSTIVLQELIITHYDELEDLVGAQFFDSILKNGDSDFREEISEIPRKITNPYLVFSSMQVAIYETGNDSLYREMLAFSQKIEQYSTLIDPDESYYLSLEFKHATEKMQRMFDDEYADDVFHIDSFIEKWTHHSVSGKLSTNSFNEAWEIYRQHPVDDAWEINKKNAKYVPYFAAFSLADAQLPEHALRNPEQAASALSSINDNPFLFEIQSAYKLTKALSKYVENVVLPINTKTEIARLNQRKKQTTKTNTNDVKEIKQLISGLQQASIGHAFTWLSDGTDQSHDEKNREQMVRLINTSMRNDFPSVKEFASMTLRRKILEKTGKDVNPDRLTLFQFNDQSWYSHHLSLSDPIAQTSATLTDYALINFQQSTRDNIDIDRNSWGIYASDYKGDANGFYDANDQFPLSPGDFAKIVIELNFYDDVYRPALDAYWGNQKNVRLEEMKNMMRVIVALKKSGLSAEGKEIVLHGLRLKRDKNKIVTTSFFDIDGYQATDMLIFTERKNHKTLLYMPRSLWLIEFNSIIEMRLWIKHAAADPDERIRILNHFPLSEQQKGIFYDGVKKWLEELGSKPDVLPDKVWKEKVAIQDSEIVETITQKQKDRLYSDAEHLTTSNLEVMRNGWIEYLSIVNTLIPNPVTPILSMLLDIEKMVDADNDDELAEAKSLFTGDVINILMMAAMEGMGRLQMHEIGSFRTSSFIRDRIATPEKLPLLHHDLLSGSNENFIGPVRISRADLLREVPLHYLSIFESHENDFFSYLDPLTKRKIYLIQEPGTGTYIDIVTNIEWQPRHYDITLNKRWETGIIRQPYARLEKFAVDSEQGRTGDSDLIVYQMEHGHYISPVEVTLSQGHLQVISGSEKIKAAMAMRLETVPYEIVATKSSVTFHREEMFVPSSRLKSDSEEVLLHSLKYQLEQGLEGYSKFIARPAENDEAAAQAVLAFLQPFRSISDAFIGTIHYWKTPTNTARTHFFVSAKCHQKTVVIDLTAHRFKNWGIKTPIISTEADWHTQLKQHFDNYPWLLAKIKDQPNGLSNTKFSPDSSPGPFENAGNAKIFSDASWYSEEGLKLTRKLQKKQQLQNEFSSTNALGASSNSGQIIIDKNVSASEQNIIQKNVGRNFKLYCGDVPARTLFLSAHGGFMRNTGEIAIPENLKIDFLGPHGRTLADPGIELINNEAWLPYATVDKQGFIGNEFKRSDNKVQFHMDVDQLKANGVDTVGAVRNYELGKFSGIETGETPQTIAKAIDTNRAKESGTRMDVLTVRDRFWGQSAKLSEVFEMMQNNPEFASYDKLIFSACRVDMCSKNAASYGIKSMELVVAKKASSGWQIMAVLNSSTHASDKSPEQAP